MFKQRASFTVLVNDGRGLRGLTIGSSDTLYDVRRNVAEILQCHYASVSLGYTAPWLKKTAAQKVTPRYLDSKEELDELSRCAEEYTAEQKRKKKPSVTCEVVIYNMNDETVIRPVFAPLLRISDI